MDVSKNRSCGWFTHLNSDPRNPKNNGTKKKPGGVSFLDVGNAMEMHDVS